MGQYHANALAELEQLLLSGVVSVTMTAAAAWQILEVNRTLVAEKNELVLMSLALADRVHKQSELLSRKAEVQ